MSNKHEVVGRAMLDAEFRKALFADPKAACEAAKLPLADHDYAQINAMDKDAFETAVADLTGGVGAG
ncbi:MAG: hypothetical protein FJ100_03500 [Deltaproteobacteria bacterium]|nr:hypothetical protein [Deltaproteobacteria bacterium]